MVSRWWKFICSVLAAEIIFFHGFSRSEPAPNYTFVHEATWAPATASYDYIIIGGGTAGCPLAATLSQNATVLLLERGGSPYGNDNITEMESFGNPLSDHSPSSPAQFFISKDGVFNSRARILGGGTALNVGFYSRAGTEYVKQMGWDQSLVNRSFEWVEKKVVFEPRVTPWQSAVRDGLIEVGVTPYNGFTYDHLHGTKVSGTIFDGEGHRHTAADLLEYAIPSRITVLLHARVQRILFRIKGNKRPKALGVVFRDELGNEHIAYLMKGSMNEIILSAGAIGSPQLLMLSGVGPKHQLKAHNISLVLDQPMVGQGMADNPMNALFIPSPHPVEVSLAQVVGITQFDGYIETIGGLALSFLLAQDQNVSSATYDGGAIIEKFVGPLSTGYLELQNKDVDDNPYVTFNYFKEPADLQRCVKGMRTILNVIDSKAFSKYRYENTSVQVLINTMLNYPLNLRPRHEINASISLEQFCVDTVVTIWHYHGGCQVGKVVDEKYKVLGVDALRVVDASTFIKSPGTNPQATIMMLGRYMGEKILQERLSDGIK